MVRQVKYVGIALLALFFSGAMAVTQAVAQDAGVYAGSMDARQHGYQHGYRDGLRQGRADLANNTSPNYDSEDYRRAELGYEEYMGPHAEFERGYRDGYKDGYDDGYKNRAIRSDVYGLRDNYDPDRAPRTDEDARYYTNWGYSDVAFDSGYRDGLSAGRKDFSERKDYR